LQDPRVASREIDWDKARAIIESAMGIPLAISVDSLDVPAALEQVPVVHHTRPVPEELVDDLPAEGPALAEPQAAQ
jgi:hypothetical protein